MEGLSDTNLKPVPGDKKNERKRKKKKARSTDLWLTVLFSTPKRPPALSKMAAVDDGKLHSSVFPQARSHDLFWKVWGPQKWTFLN